MITTSLLAAAAAPSGGASFFIQTIPLVLVFVIFYMLLIRPQQKRMKQHQQMVSTLKRGDTVVLSSGVIGKVSKVDDAEVAVDIAPSVSVKVVKSMISEVRNRTEPAAANDAKS